MKTVVGLVSLSLIATMCSAEPVRVAVLDFENKANLQPGQTLTGNVAPDSLAAKGVDAMTEQLVNQNDISVIDRRDFIRQTQTIEIGEEGKKELLKPSFLRAAQAVNADSVIRGTLVSCNPSKRQVTVGGNNTEFLGFTVRVTLEALDTTDGSVSAMKSGTAKKEFRQTNVQKTTLGEDDLYQMISEAIGNALPGLVRDVEARAEKRRNRPVATISVKTDADPALVEIDGTLVGTTPMEKLEIYQGDHVLTIGKPGYVDVNKRIQVKDSLAIEVPMLRTKLSADEMKEVMEKMRMDVVVGVPEPPIIIRSFQE